MYVSPSYAHDHDHNFWTLLAGTYHMVGLCRLVGLISTFFMQLQYQFHHMMARLLTGICYSSLLHLVLEVTSLLLIHICPLHHR